MATVTLVIEVDNAPAAQASLNELVTAFNKGTDAPSLPGIRIIDIALGNHLPSPPLKE